MFVFFSRIIVAIPTAIAAFYLPVTLMCLLYFRIYRETVKRRKELHLLQAQHHTSPVSSTTNNTSASRSTKNFPATAAVTALERDESISSDSNRSHGKVNSLKNSSAKKLIPPKKNFKDRFNDKFDCCCETRYDCLCFKRFISISKSS